MLTGWQKKRAYEAAIVRKQTQLIYGMVGGKENFMNIWPIDLIDGVDKDKATMTRKEAIKAIHLAQEREMKRRALQN